VLDAVDFWRKLEVLVSAITGWQPRDDDMEWAKKTD
jgi:hypothetical protein